MEITASQIGSENLGELLFTLAWSVGPGNLCFSTVSRSQNRASEFEEVSHAIPTTSIYVSPNRVLYWDPAPNGLIRLNSLSRFRYMLGNRAVANLESAEIYLQSFTDALVEQEIVMPSQQRLRTLGQLASKYLQPGSNEQPEYPSMLHTSTVRILFTYIPPKDSRLSLLYDYLIAKIQNS